MKKYIVDISEFKRDKITFYRDDYFSSRPFDLPLSFDWRDIEAWRREDFEKSLERTQLSAKFDFDNLVKIIKDLFVENGYSDLYFDAFIKRIKALDGSDIMNAKTWAINIWLPNMVEQDANSSFRLSVYYNILD